MGVKIQFDAEHFELAVSIYEGDEFPQSIIELIHQDDEPKAASLGIPFNGRKKTRECVLITAEKF